MRTDGGTQIVTQKTAAYYNMSRQLPYRPEDLDGLYHLLEAQFVSVVSEMLSRLELPVKKYRLFGDPAPATRAANVENLDLCKKQLAEFEKAMSYLLMANDRSDPRRYDAYTEKYNDLVRILGRSRHRTTQRATEAVAAAPAAGNAATLHKRRKAFLRHGAKAFRRLFEVIPSDAKDSPGCQQLSRIMNLANDKRSQGGSLTPQVFIDNAAFYIKNAPRAGVGAGSSSSSSNRATGNGGGGGGGGRVLEFPPVPLHLPEVPTHSVRTEAAPAAAAAGRVAVAIPYSMGGGARKTKRRHSRSRKTRRNK